ncbi:MAG: hypothetical protein AB1746_07575, partial [Candidatus Zixiibacteriota bacterium]
KLPDRLADAIGYHHTPSMDNQSDNLAFLINLANFIAHNGLPVDTGGLSNTRLDPETIKFFKIDDSYIDQLKSRLIDEYMKAETFMKIAGMN